MNRAQVNHENKIMLKHLNSKGNQVRQGTYTIETCKGTGSRIEVLTPNGGCRKISPRYTAAKEIHGQLSAILEVLSN